MGTNGSGTRPAGTPVTGDGTRALVGVLLHRTLPTEAVSRFRFNNDAGSQYTSVRFTERLLEAGIDASIGTGRRYHDNALAESVNGLYKTELIKPRRPWRNANHVEAETATYLDWFNNRRLYEYCGDMPPVKSEVIFYSGLSIDGVA